MDSIIIQILLYLLLNKYLLPELTFCKEILTYSTVYIPVTRYND